MPLSDLACLSALDALDALAALPETCNPEPLVDEGLIERGDDGLWRLTIKGRVKLVNLRSLERARQSGRRPPA